MISRRLFACVLLVALGAPGPACGGGGGGNPAGIPYRQFLASVSPATGPTTGGTEVTLEGRGFLEPDLPILGIRIGAHDVASWQVVNDTTIRLITPPSVAGPATILLLGVDSPRLDGGVLARGFTYVPPTTLQLLGLGPP